MDEENTVTIQKKDVIHNATSCRREECYIDIATLFCKAGTSTPSVSVTPKDPCFLQRPRVETLNSAELTPP